MDTKMKNTTKKSIKLHSFRRITAFLCVILSVFAVTGCKASAQPITKTAFFFNTVISITFYSQSDADLFPEVENLCRKYENMLSRTVEGSDIYNINHAGGDCTEVSAETAELINTALSYCELTDGMVDITIAPLMDLWNFTDGETTKAPPSDEEIQALLSHVDYRNVIVEDNCVELSDPEASIDLGFIAKGYIADKVKEFLVSKGVESAIVNLGGNVNLIGSKPGGESYSVGIRKPFGAEGEYMDSVSVSDTSLVTSGIYERCFRDGDKFYHHILNPHTGYPVENSLTQVSVICRDSTKADALSTTLLLLGKEKGLEFIESMDDASAMFVEEGDIVTTSDDFLK